MAGRDGRSRPGPTAAQSQTSERGASTEGYRSKTSWDSVYWGTHCVNCLSTCPYRVYVRDGKVVYEEPAGTHRQIEPGVPDMNPMGCQKGSTWSGLLHSSERILYPMKRLGERGSGRWQRISWDEALTEIADSILDAIRDEGPESVVVEESVEGGLLTWAAYLRFAGLIGAVTLDGNGLINDFPTGQWMTFGKFSGASSVDDTFHSELILIWHANPVYTWIPFYHYIAEARYRGAEVVTIAPDVSPSTVHADYYVPIRPGTDAAFALAMCQVLIEENLFDRRFVLEQTDLPFLVRLDNRRFLRASDLSADGKDDQFYWLDAGQGVTEANRASLDLNGAEPALEGRAVVTLRDGEEVEVTPVFAVLREQLAAGYTPEQASEVSGVHPDTIRLIARKAAKRRTKVQEGFDTPKHYHGDLMERAMCLFLALTGNWGKKGTGIQGLALAGLDGYFLFPSKTGQGQDQTRRMVDAIAGLVTGMQEQDPGLTEEMAGYQVLQAGVPNGSSTPPAFFWYYHCGYRENWNNRDWADPTMQRPFDDYFQEAIDRGWWAGIVRPGPDVTPRVFLEVGCNALRRARGGQTMLLKHLWPKLKMVATVDFRMSASARYSDILLPAAAQYERPNVQYALTHTFELGFSDRAVDPPGEAKTEWEIFALLSAKVSERARLRDFTEFRDSRRRTRRLDNLWEDYTANGAFINEEAVIDEWVRDSTVTGTLPEGAGVDTLRERGFIRFQGLGIFSIGLSVATDVREDETLTAYRWHVEKKLPYPTLTRRAQFYIDHPWFIEAGEALPVHKEPPKMGGDYPFVVTGGHPRWSIHAVNVANRFMLESTRGRPALVMNAADALARRIADGETVCVENDLSRFLVPVRVSPSVRPGQVILYNGWEPYMFPGGAGGNDVEPGLIKWLHLVARYGHLRYLPFSWQPVPADRLVRVDVRKLSADQQARLAAWEDATMEGRTPAAGRGQSPARAGQ